MCANRAELYKLKFQERKFNQSKETPKDFLTDVTRLANIAFADSGGNDYSAERTRRIRDAFISGMLTQIRLKLLMQPETTTVTDLCASVSKRLTLKSILPDEEAQATGFNAITDNSSSSLVTALNNIAAAIKSLASSQRELGRQMNKMQVSVDRSNNRKFHRGNLRGDSKFNSTQTAEITDLQIIKISNDNNSVTLAVVSTTNVGVVTDPVQLSVGTVVNRATYKVNVGLNQHHSEEHTCRSIRSQKTKYAAAAFSYSTS